MSAIGALPEFHDWVDGLNEAQVQHLVEIVHADQVLPPIEVELVGYQDHAKEIWLRTTAVATFDRIKAGGGNFMSIDEARARLNKRRSAA